MDCWKIDFKRVDKKFRKLDQQTQRLIIDYLRNRILKADHPTAYGKPLKYDLKDFWCYRISNFRLICDIQDHTLTILVLQIGKRDKVYD